MPNGFTKNYLQAFFRSKGWPFRPVPADEMPDYLDALEAPVATFKADHYKELHAELKTRHAHYHANLVAMGFGDSILLALLPCSCPMSPSSSPPATAAAQPTPRPPST